MAPGGASGALSRCPEGADTNSNGLDFVPVSASFGAANNCLSAPSTPANHVVISEVGGCRGSGAAGGPCATPVASDLFVELYNPTAAPVSITGWCLQRRTPAGTSTSTAVIPGGVIFPRSFFLIGGVGYTASNYAGSPAPDFASAFVMVFGTAGQSVVLWDGACGSSSVVDAVSMGAGTTDALVGLELPAFANVIVDGTSMERKACGFSAPGGSAWSGMDGGHVARGNSEDTGINANDWLARSVPGPQNSSAPVESLDCP